MISLTDLGITEEEQNEAMVEITTRTGIPMDEINSRGLLSIILINRTKKLEQQIATLLKKEETNETIFGLITKNTR